ncbi:SAM-dependent methyltransferase RsmB/NOP2-type [Trinorchestia longiramus]|nr:SAM-dependent methyltransferase RsmB/NOP2-type [Trinorchestia longiramus]
MNYCRGKFLKIYSTFPVRDYASKVKKKGCELAKEYFDVSYSNVYGSEWPSIRLGLLSEPKFVSIINNHCPKYEETIEEFQKLGSYDVGPRYRKYCDEVMAEQSRSLLTEVNDGNTTDPNVEAMENSSDQHNHESSALRKPVREFTDDELSELASTPAPPVYPKEFRALSGTPEMMVSEPDGDRLILPQRHVEVAQQLQALQDFMPSKGLAGLPGLSDESAIFEKYRATLDSDSSPPIEVEKQRTPISWPDMLTVLAFPRLNNTRFPKPRLHSGLYNHYPLDGGSLLPVLALDVQPGNLVLDMCAAPGGKSLALMQTTMPGFLHCNDKSSSRMTRLEIIMKQYFGDTSRASKSLQITRLDGTMLTAGEAGLFDRVLVDAPCQNDRYSLQVRDHYNIFNLSNRQERLALPEQQADLLMRALQLVRVGGVVVYSTCSLSPVQNDGVVHLALTRLWDQTNAQYTVMDFSRAMEPFKFFLDFGKELGLKYGQVILPRASNNFGPTYCAKIIRKK